MPANVTITPWSAESCGNALGCAALGLDATASAIWPTANTAYFFPFTLLDAVTIVKMFSLTGAATAANIDVAVYDALFNKKFGTVGVPQGAANVVQSFDTADTVLTPGIYYLAVCLDNVGGSLFRQTSTSLAFNKGIGMFEQAAANVPMPATATPATVLASYIPVFGATVRTLV